MSRADEVLVAGGGIAGLTAALFLGRLGRRVRVLERAAEFAELGAGLQLAPNATRILDRLGLLREILRSAVTPRRLVLLNAISGDELTSLELGDFDRRYGAPYIVMHRSDLLDSLVSACRAEPDVTLEIGRTVAAVTRTDGGVEVGCADGTSFVGAALIGADGLGSMIRAGLRDDEPINSHYVAYRGTTPTDLDGSVELRDVKAWIGPGLHFVQYPLRRGELLNHVAVFRSDRSITGDEHAGGPDELDERFAPTCDDVHRGLGALWRDRHWAMYDREPIDNWSDGPITLIGDAAHPMLQYLAQGACQAIEDGAVARRCSRRAPNGHRDRVRRVSARAHPTHSTRAAQPRASGATCGTSTVSERSCATRSFASGPSAITATWSGCTASALRPLC